MAGGRRAGRRPASGIAAAGGDILIDLVETAGEDFDSTQAAVAAYLDQNPLPGAIVGANDRLAIAAMSLLESRGIAVPGDVRVTGFNGFEVAPLRPAAHHHGHIAGLRDGRARRCAPPRKILRRAGSRCARSCCPSISTPARPPDPAAWEGGRPRPPFSSPQTSRLAISRNGGRGRPPSQESSPWHGLVSSPSGRVWR